MGYHTKQKERILDLLKTCAGEHLTVSDLGKQLEENGTPVGTATIYRYLEQLTEEGVLRKYILDGKSSACYQYLGEHATCQEHFHLKCLSCGTLFHVQCTFLDEMQAHIAAHHHFQIDHTKTVLYGYCEQCQNAQQTVGTISSCMLLVLLKCWRKRGCLLFRRFFIDANWGMV